MNQELVLFFHSVWMGAVLLLLYDCLRIFRQILLHSSLFIALEDLCYWIFSAIYIFGEIFQENRGMIRSFVFIGILLGMLCYHQSISPVFVSFFVKILGIPVKYISFEIKRLLFFIKRCSIYIRRHSIWKKKRLAGIEHNKKQTKKKKAP